MSRRQSRKQRRDPANLDAVPFYTEIHEAFSQPGCPLCRLLDRDADRYLDSVLWELVNDWDVRGELNQARGYCQQHGWMLVRPGAALGISILMRDVVRTLLEVLASNPAENMPESVLQGMFRRLEMGEVPDLFRDLDKRPENKKTARLVETLSPQAPCPVCARLQTRELEYVHTLVAYLEPPGSLAEVYTASGGLCLDHFRQALPPASAVQMADTLVAAQQAVWERLHDELAEFARKNDPRFRGEPFGEERDSWRRALEVISGPQPRAESGRGGLTQAV